MTVVSLPYAKAMCQGFHPSIHFSKLGFDSQEEGVEEDVAHVIGEILFALACAASNMKS